MFELAVFDLDGVLTESSKQHFEAWKELAEELNIPFSIDDNEALKGISRLESLEIILSKDPQKRLFTDEEKFAFTTKKNENYVNLIKHFTKDNLFVGVEELLIKLREKGLRIALASASKNAPDLIRLMEIDKYIDHVVNPSTLKKGKPDPEIFLKAASYFKIKCENTIGFEDAKAGVEAIKAAGIYAVGVGDREILKEADIVIDHIKDFHLNMI